jgi:hypothetical protein
MKLTCVFVLQGAFFMERVSGITPRAFIAGVAKQLGDESTALVCQAYNITPDMDANLFTTAALRWIGDVIFDGKEDTSLGQHFTDKQHQHLSTNGPSI